MYKYFEFITEHKDKGDPHDLLRKKNIEYSSQQKSSSITSEDLL